MAQTFTKTKPKNTFRVSNTETLAEPEDTNAKPKSKFPWLWIFLGFALVVCLVAAGIGSVVWWYVSGFTQAAGISNQQLVTDLKTGWHTSPKNTNDITSILILGVDEIAGQKEGSMLTDTMIVASLNSTKHQIDLISLPRDLWIDSLKTKINALYYYGQLSDDTSGSKLTSSVVSEITGLPVDYVMVIKLTALEQIINTLGGVDVNVPQAFTDNQFPRSDVDIHAATSEAQLYETITFQQGPQHMDGVTAMKYIRSRHSTNLDEGTDNARSGRQQDLIQAIIARLKTKEILKNPYVLGNLYKIYHTELTTDLTDQELIGLLRLEGSTVPSLKPISLPVQENGQTGVIYHPPDTKHDQWVYEPIDPSWKEVSSYIQDQL